MTCTIPLTTTPASADRHSALANRDSCHSSRGSSVLPRRVHADVQCDPHLAHAIDTFFDAIESRTRTDGKRLALRSISQLCQRHVSPSLEACVARFCGVGDARRVLEYCTPHPFDEAFGDAKRLHRLADRLYEFLRPVVLRNEDDKFAGLVGTLHNLAAFLASWPSPQRITTKHEQGMKGGNRRLRSAEELLSLADWPYCELCWKLSQRAARLERDAGQTRSSLLSGLSERFCTDHVPEAGTRYWSSQRTKDRFGLLVQKVHEEIAANPAYRQRFVSTEADVAWQATQCVTADTMEQWLSRDLPPISPLQMRARFLAHEISRRLPRQIANALQIDSLQCEAVAKTGALPTLGEVAAKLGMTKQAVWQRMRIGGLADSAAESPHLRWWPFDNFGLHGNQPRPTADSEGGQIEWHAPVWAYLRGIYPSLQSVNWKPIKAFKLAS